MNTPVTINNQTIPIREYKGQRVVTFKDIDAVHGRSDGTARRNFNTNKNRFIMGVDYFVRKTDEAAKEFGIVAPNGLTLITESGYLMLAKSFTDDLAWQVQRKLVNCYFHSKPAQAEPEQITLGISEEYCFIPKTFKGIPAFSMRDIEHFANINRWALERYLKNQCRKNKDYILLKDSALADYKRENPGAISRSSSKEFVVMQGCVHKLNKKFHCNIPLPTATLTDNKNALSESSNHVIETAATNERPAAPTLPHKQNDYTIAIAVLGEIRRGLVQSGNGEGAESVNAAINYTAWELSRNMMEGNI